MGAYRFAAVVLAAGYSSRMKSFKPLLPVGGMTAIERILESIRAAGITETAAVTGHSREKLWPVLQMRGIHEAYNSEFDKGMFSSVKTGVSYVLEHMPDTAGCFLFPADCPLTGRDTLERLLSCVRSAPDRFHVPVYEGKKGHPLFIPRRHMDEICRYEGGKGLKGVTDRYSDSMVRVPVENEGCVMDMDTPEAYRELTDFYEGGCRRSDIRDLARGRDIYLIRHGQTRQHSEKMMIGQYDVPLSAEGRMQAAETARRLADELKGTGCIYASDLCRAAETAGILADGIAGAGGERPHIVEMKALREISLGSWDGKPISFIRSEYPDEYRKRGEDIFTFKTGNHFENFYDLQYRTVGAVRKILLSDSSKRIVIAAHSGVIRAVGNNLRGLRVDDAWEKVPKGGFVHIKV